MKTSNNNKVLHLLLTDSLAGTFWFYNHTNHLGSIEKITDKNGHVADSMSYTPFGQRRMFSDWSKTDTAKHLIDRGFTGQQHLDNFALINFNGRMYDPVLAHFLSPDPYIQAPENPLNHNRYSYCLFSPLQYVDPSGEIVEINDDIVIKGKNNSSITVKTDLIDWTINIDKDFGGNFILTPDNVAFGYEYGVDATGKAVIGSSYTGYKQSLIFLSGSYAGYWYDYIGGEAQMDVSSSAGGSIGVHGNYFIAINNEPEKYTPKGYQGMYFGTSLSGSFEALGGISLNVQHATSKENSWTTISLGASVSIGAQINFFAGFGASAGAHLGGTRLIGSQPVETRQRSKVDIISNWISHLFY